MCRSTLFGRLPKVLAANLPITPAADVRPAEAATVQAAEKICVPRQSVNRSADIGFSIR
jgi:hypothetical protein